MSEQFDMAKYLLPRRLNKRAPDPTRDDLRPISRLPANAGTTLFHYLIDVRSVCRDPPFCGNTSPSGASARKELDTQSARTRPRKNGLLLYTFSSPTQNYPFGGLVDFEESRVAGANFAGSSEFSPAVRRDSKMLRLANVSGAFIDRALGSTSNTLALMQLGAIRLSVVPGAEGCNAITGEYA